jgi:hypothetical protein
MNGFATLPGLVQLEGLNKLEHQGVAPWDKMAAADAV